MAANRASILRRNRYNLLPARGRTAGSPRNLFPLSGKTPETCFHCLEKVPKHGSIPWKNRENTFPLSGKRDRGMNDGRDVRREGHE